MSEKGTLYIVSTPIGNLQDITLRALQTLKDVDFILCEDTRHSIKLLNHFEIKKPLISYHKFNEVSAVDHIIEELLNGKNAALISDAGTPLISDPGYILVDKLIENEIEFTVIPGANALLPALILSGFDTSKFLFLGFLPKKKNKREKTLEEIKDSGFPVIIYVSPHELKDVFGSIDHILPQRRLSLSKEISKIHEMTYRGSAAEITSMLVDEIKGEYVLVIDKQVESETLPIDIEQITDIELKKLFDSILIDIPNKKEALKKLAEKLQVNKRVLYNRLLKNESDK